jgi:glycosyltransferase involved in cell wall biosynthesis
MKVLHLNTYDITGGAARAAHGLHKGLGDLGYDSSMFVCCSSSNDPTVVPFQPRRDFVARLTRRLRSIRIKRDFACYRQSRPAGYELFSDDRAPYGDDLLAQLPVTDVINLHWIAGFIDYQSFFASVPRATPVIWTLHDMNAFTGGCHYSFGCERYTERCGVCPQLGSHDHKDLAEQVWQRKREIFTRIGGEGRLRIVAPSRWLTHEAKRSALSKHLPVSFIPYGVDIQTFAPQDRSAARDAFGISRDARVILFVSHTVGNRRKGFSLLLQALTDLRLTNVRLISVGDGEPTNGSIPSTHLGFIDNDRLLSRVYSAADLLVVPSLQDNLPNSILEAMACGTPVVGFNIGGIPDIVRPGITGMLAPGEDAIGLRAAMIDLLRSRERQATMAAACRRVIIQEFTLELQARRYAELYETAIERLSPDDLSEVNPG